MFKNFLEIGFKTSGKLWREKKDFQINYQPFGNSYLILLLRGIFY